jgi:hypothetical protein
MIREDKNIALLKRWMAYYQVPEYTDEHVKVLHYVLASYDDDSVGDAIEYLRDRYEPDWRAAQQQQQAQQHGRRAVTAPGEERHTVHGVPVVLQSRAFRHIPPSLWDGFRDVVVTGSLAKKIQDAGADISSWRDVSSTSDESFTFGDRNAAIRTVASWDSGELAIYHAHPDLLNYDTYF